mmetsp:Transcript_57084/g.133948  ORF Transcript_57084/g.133948 Transcript_57084/m.133948 type:complete len:293 (-) Transcript_57084:272-1150(-)
MYDGGKPVAVKTLGQQIAGIYEAKVVADGLDDKQGRKRGALPDFLKNYLIRQYGLKSIAMKNLQNMAAGVRKEWESSLRLKVFGTVSGMIDDDKYQEGHCDVLCEALKNLFATDQIKERLSDRDCESLPIQSVAYATLIVFTSKFYFRDQDDVVLVPGSEPDLGPSVKQQLLDLAEGDHTEPSSLQVSVDKWSEWLLGSYDESYRNAEQFFEQLYAAHDANKDNVLDFSEFSNVIKVVDTEKSEEEILAMYNEALEATGEGDNISVDAFVHVAMSNHLACMKQPPKDEKEEA